MNKIDLEKYRRFVELLHTQNPALAVFYTDTEPSKGLQPSEGNPAARIVKEYQAQGKAVPFEELHRNNRCAISFINRVLRKGGTVYFDKDHYGCMGGAHWMGYNPGASDVAAHVISTGIPNITDGEHIFKSYESAKIFIEEAGAPAAAAKYLVVKRLEDLEESEEAEVIVFLEKPDVISGIFGLIAFSLGQADGVISPFGSGCSSIITYPMKETRSASPRAVLGMLDAAARPEIDPEILSLAIPAEIFAQLLEDMEDSFLKGCSWELMSERILKRRGEAT